MTEGGTLALFGLFIVAGTLRLLLWRYRVWKVERNSLPDEERAQLFWNDQNYERLERGITRFWFGLFIVSACLTALVLILRFW